MPRQHGKLKLSSRKAIAECNGDIGILTERSETAVSAHEQYKFGQTAQNDWGDVWRRQVAMHRNATSFFIVYYVAIKHFSLHITRCRSA